MTFDLLGVVSRWAVFSGLLIAVGAVVFDFWILQGDPEASPGGRDEEAPLPSAAFSPARAAAGAAMSGAMVLVLGSMGRLAAEFAVFRDPFESASAELTLLVSGTSFGTAWLVQFGLGIFACTTFLAASRSTPGGGAAKVTRWGALVATCSLAFTPAFSGHAAGSAHLRGLAITSDVTHVIAGGAWLGTLAVIAFVASRARALAQPISADRLVMWVARFSPLALICAGLIAATGVFASWLHLDTLSSLWTTPYGQRLLIKVGILGVIVGFGAYNWKQSRGKIAVSGDPARLPGSVRAELIAGLVILLVTAILVTTPPPGE